jgi:hypothetical protein
MAHTSNVKLFRPWVARDRFRRSCPILENLGPDGAFGSSRSTCHRAICTSPTLPSSCLTRLRSTTTVRGGPSSTCLESLLRDEAENDGFNRLVLLAGLNGRQIGILRAYRRYLRQAGLPFSQAYIEQCLATHSSITARSGRPLRSLVLAKRRRCACQSHFRRAERGSAAGQQSQRRSHPCGHADGHRGDSAHQRRRRRPPALRTRRARRPALVGPPRLISAPRCWVW